MTSVTWRDSVRWWADKWKAEIIQKFQLEVKENEVPKAIRITEKTLPLIKEAFPALTANNPPEQLYGRFLVYDESPWTPYPIVIMHDEVFQARYKFVGVELEERLTEIEPIKKEG